MAPDARWRLMVPRWARRMPADLAAIVGLTLLTIGAVFLPFVQETPLRVVVGLPFVLFVPGYALVAALFPERGPPEDTDEAELDSAEGGITGLERVALSFGVSIAVVPLVGLVLNFTPWGIRLVPIVVSLTGLVVGLVVIAARRRAELDPDRRFRVPWRAWLTSARGELFEPDTRTDAALNVLLVVSILLAVSSVGYAVAVPQQGESFSEFYLLTEGPDGELVADDYPTEFSPGQGQELVVGIGNQEHENVDYTVLVEIHEVQVQNNSTRLIEREELRQFDPSLAHNETWQQPHTVTPTMTGERLRLTYLLYRGAPPQTPTTDNAYRELHLWVNVTQEGGATANVRPVAPASS
ncbi:DUF1616 domain-containing protein [Salinigranum marinum]|uniref:DUF1616 domain-containing protein n=1 Tax=Salinigranum marinum TaxID=1515595 RepID=UPI002989DEC8|nr:DUF1616 domain-containing protein [Salinigranum marinum]